jgi:hypothetical protein
MQPVAPISLSRYGYMGVVSRVAEPRILYTMAAISQLMILSSSLSTTELDLWGFLLLILLVFLVISVSRISFLDYNGSSQILLPSAEIP